MGDTGKHYSIVDGGADTVLEGGRCFSLAYSSQCFRQWIWYDMAQEGLPIGTSATKVSAEDENELILI